MSQIQYLPTYRSVSHLTLCCAQSQTAAMSSFHGSFLQTWLFWSKQSSASITPFFPSHSFLSSLLSSGVQELRNISLAFSLSMLAANRSQYFCPWVSCVTCPLNYFPLLTFLTASGGLPEQSGYCAYPHMLWYARELQLHPALCMKVWGQNWIRLSTDKITRGL